MFILPLMAILLGIEFYLVFERTTNTYEKGLKEGYFMLAVTKKPMELSAFQSLNEHISTAEKIKRESIVSEVAKGISQSSSKEILAALPYFYNLGLEETADRIETNRIGGRAEALNYDILGATTVSFGRGYVDGRTMYSEK